MRAIWKGSVSFGLVNIPVSLYPATRRENLKFRLLRRSDLSPVNYKRVAEADDKEVPWDEIVKGYEYEKGRFVVLNEQDFKRVDIEATQTVDIVDFVKLEEIDPMYFDKPYYLEPLKSGAKAYVLLRDALKKTGKVGIATVVIKTRQHLAAVKPLGTVLVLELMHFPEELVESSQFKVPAVREASAKEQKMAVSLMDSMTADWDPGKYVDNYRSALLDLIKEKVRHGGKASAIKEPQRKRPSNVVDLVSVLQESLDQSRKQSPVKTRKPSGKSRRKTKKAA